jgi:hypothetical protein
MSLMAQNQAVSYFKITQKSVLALTTPWFWNKFILILDARKV